MGYLAAVKAWNRSKPETLLHLPRLSNPDPRTGERGWITDHLSDTQFEVWRNEHARQIKQRLRNLRTREQLRAGIGINGYAVERKLADLQSKVSRRVRHQRNASYLAQNFTQDQLRIIYCLLDDLEELLPKRPIIALGEVYDLIRLRKQAMK